MKILLFILLFVAAEPCIAQEERPEFGQVTLADFAPTPFDSTASSVILFDKGTFEYGSVVPLAERHIRVKIISKDAYAMWGDFKLGSRMERPYKIKTAVYYVEDGKVVSHEVGKDEFLKDRKGHQTTISLTSLREGCIVELSFRVTYRYYSAPFWSIQQEVPVLWSEFLLDAGVFSRKVLRGDFEPYISNAHYKGKYQRWVFKNIAPLKVEPLMPDPTNFVARIECWESFGSWIGFKNNYLSDYKIWFEYYKPKLQKSDIIHTLDSIADPLEKVKAACSYIKAHYLWTGDFDFMLSSSNILEEKEGASGDLNTLLYSVLDLAGLNPELVFLSTPGHGIIVKDVPSRSQFNYVLCAVKVRDKRFFLDVTNPRLPFNVVPSWCTNMQGFLAAKQDSAMWVEMNPEMMERTNVYAWLSVAKDQMLTGKVTSVKQGYEAVEDNETYETEGERKFASASIPNDLWVSDSAKVNPLKQEKLEMSVTHFGSLPGYVTESPGKLYVNPYISFGGLTNILKDSTRAFPVDFRQSFEKRLIATITIPDDYKVESLPSSQILSLQDKGITCMFKSAASGKMISVVFQMSLQKTWFEPEEYGNLREFFNRIIAMQDEMIVLSKI
jgi:hypothetical protein